MEKSIQWIYLINIITKKAGDSCRSAGAEPGHQAGPTDSFPILLWFYPSLFYCICQFPCFHSELSYDLENRHRPPVPGNPHCLGLNLCQTDLNLSRWRHTLIVCLPQQWQERQQAEQCNKKIYMCMCQFIFYALLTSSMCILFLCKEE